MEIGSVDYDAVGQVAGEDGGGGPAEELGADLGPQAVGADDHVAVDAFTALESHRR